MSGTDLPDGFIPYGLATRCPVLALPYRHISVRPDIPPYGLAVRCLVLTCVCCHEDEGEEEGEGGSAVQSELCGATTAESRTSTPPEEAHAPAPRPGSPTRPLRRVRY
eukprot:3941923-Rhodomonas_salina.4